MLVLARKHQEVIYIGPDIRIVLVEARVGSARIGIEAPKHLQIMRKEVLDRDTVLDPRTAK